MGRALALAVLLGVGVEGSAQTLDAALWARLLERHTAAVADTAGVRVAYRALQDEPDWRRLLESLAQAEPDALGSRDAKLAFWINAYNVLAIDVVRRSYPLESIRDAGSLLRPVWKREAGRVGGKPRTLDEIEHAILRPMGEPRIHAAIVCASTSCPSLRREPYVAERLDAQLDDALRRFLADPGKGSRLDRERGTLWLSAIFDWFEEDFEPAGGVVAYLETYLPEATRRWLAEHRDTVRVRHFDYDWSLNDLRSASSRSLPQKR